MSQTFGIDNFGNMSVIGGTLGPSLQFDSNNRILGYGYDASGNVTQVPLPAGGIQQYNYDSLGRIASLGDPNSPSARYTYNSDGTRVRKDTPSSWTEYIRFGDAVMAEKNSAGTWSDYIFANGQRIARLDPTTNLVQNSQAFAAANWSGYCGPTSNMTVNTTDVAAPDGTSTATRLVMPNTLSCDWSQPSIGMLTTVPGGLQAGSTYTVSLWMRGAQGGELVGFGMNDCAFTSVSLATSWQRYQVTFPAISSSVANCYDGTRGFELAAGNALGSTFYVWGAQVEQASSAGPYIATGASTDTLHYYTSDHLGTTSVVTDAVGALKNDSDFYPYGYEVPITTGDTNHYRFTGQERDSESGNDFFNARYYNSVLGRFFSPDPSGLSAADPDYPQSFNLYAYVLNNPLIFVDPDGEDCVYLNNDGSDFDRDSYGNIIGIDKDSSRGECDKNKGYWVDGTVSHVTLYTNIDDVGLTGHLANGTETDSYYINIHANRTDLDDFLVRRLGAVNAPGPVDLVRLIKNYPTSSFSAQDPVDVWGGCVVDALPMLALNVIPATSDFMIIPDVLKSMSSGSVDPLFPASNQIHTTANAVDLVGKGAKAATKIAPLAKYAKPIAKRIPLAGIPVAILDSANDVRNCAK